jgi:hypothetical protein
LIRRRETKRRKVTLNDSGKRVESWRNVKGKILVSRERRTRSIKINLILQPKVSEDIRDATNERLVVRRIGSLNQGNNCGL